jgi:hypothetical protein
MKTIRTLALLAAAFVLLFASGAQAAEQFPPMYFGMSLGGYAPAGTDLDDADAKTGFVGLVNFGYMFSPFLGVQTDFGYFETSGNDNLKITSIPLAFSLKLAVPIAFMEPYLLGGGGVYFTKLKGDEFSDASSTDFGAQAAGGINFIFGNFQFGAEARYLWITASNDIQDFDIEGFQLMGTLGVRF